MPQRLPERNERSRVISSIYFLVYLSEFEERFLSIDDVDLSAVSHLTNVSCAEVLTGSLTITVRGEKTHEIDT